MIRGSGARALLHPFGDEHTQLREDDRPLGERGDRPHVDAWEAAREFPRGLYNPPLSSASSGSRPGGPEKERREAIARGELTHTAISAGIREVTMAKLYSQRACVEVADECVGILGGYGYMREYGVERALRDARLGRIGGGTDEVMKEILGRQLGL